MSRKVPVDTLLNLLDSMHDPYDAEVYYRTVALLFQYSCVESAANTVRTSELLLDKCLDESPKYAEQYRELCTAKRDLSAREAELDNILEQLYALEEQGERAHYADD